jgi:hypothetical protein
LPFSPIISIVLLQNLIQLFTILRNQRRLATKIMKKAPKQSVFLQKDLYCMSRLYYSTLVFGKKNAGLQSKFSMLSFSKMDF